ncbi:MAG: hypothetical protein NTV55_10670, partial [Planctomycetota bacterium]|nr:hypothetical protein [Planctomycetota bacterium]
MGSSTSGATAPGGLTYNPGSGTVLDAGTQVLQVTAAATNNYLSATKSVTLIVTQAGPGSQTITWATPANITYGTLLSTLQLNATVTTSGPSAPGALTYTPAVGALLNAGTQTLLVTAAATNNYAASTQTVTLIVDKALPTITWANPASITYGTPLSTTQLNATVAGSSTTGTTSPGGLTYTPGSGTVLDAGTQTLQVTAAATSNYLAATKSVTLIVTQAGPGSQTITWATPANITYGTLLSDLQLNATVTASGPSAPGALTYSPAKGALLNAGTQTLSVTAAATNNYAASTQSVTLIVDKAIQTITWVNPANITYGTLLSATQLNAMVAGSSTAGATAPGLLTYNPVSGTLLNAGSQTLVVTAAGTSNYLESTKSVTLVVDKATQTITWANPANITYGTPLSATQLNATVAGSSTAGATSPGGLVYDPPAGTLIDAGSYTLNVVAAATGNYLQASRSVTLKVDKAAQNIFWKDPDPITYGVVLTQTSNTSQGLLTAPQLNAIVIVDADQVSSMSAPGTLVYDPPAGTLLNAGTLPSKLSVKALATPNYLEATKSVTLMVDKAAQTITWANPASITYGTPLSATQLNATVVGSSTSGATAPGGLTYNPGSGT